jgi:GNAT superfamily N-acetyltransferase
VYTLRPPTSDDFERLLELQTSAYRGWVEAGGGAWDPGRARRNLAQAFAGELAVIEVDGRLAGALTVRWDEDPVVLDGIEIAAAYRGRGLGTRIVHDVCDRARSLGRDVVLDVLRHNPARELWLRLGFRESDATSTHAAMRWRADAEGIAALARGLAPWLDEARRGRWAARAFADPVDAEVGFLRFVARRYGLPDAPRVHAGAIDDRLRMLGAIAGTPGELDLVVAADLLEHVAHADRRAAAVRARESLREGGILVVLAPNMPWVLRHEPDPLPRTIVYYRALVSRITDRKFDFDAGIMTLRDTWVAEVEDEPTVEWTTTRTLALAGAPEVRVALAEAGFVEIDTFSDLDATTLGRARGKRLLLVARAP